MTRSLISLRARASTIRLSKLHVAGYTALQRHNGHPALLEEGRTNLFLYGRRRLRYFVH